MRKVELTISINVKAARIIAAFTEPILLNAWWGVERSLIELKTGGCYTLAWNITDKGFGFVSSGIIKSYDPNGLFEIEKLVYLNPEKAILGPMQFTVKVVEKQGSSEMYLCQHGYQEGGDWDWYYEAVKEAWPQVGKTLKSFLETNPG